MHGSVVSSCGRPLHMIDEVKGISSGFEKAREFINGTRPVSSGVGLHFSGLAWWMFEFQPILHGFRYFDYLFERVYLPLTQVQLRPDVIDPAAPLDDYQMILSPFLPALDEADLRQRIYDWVQNGGTWIVGPLSDIRTIHATKYTHAPFGTLEEWAKVRCLFEVPGHPKQFSFKWSDGSPSEGSVWYSAFETREAEVLATFNEYPFGGTVAITCTEIGKGRVILLGTLPVVEDFKSLVLSLARGTGLSECREVTPNVLVVPRKGPAGDGLIVLEMDNTAGYFMLNRPAVDILTGKEYSGMVDVKPYQVMVLS